MSSLRMESQDERIGWLGESPLWRGQAYFARPARLPANELIWAPGEFEGTCARCRQGLQASVTGGKRRAFNVVVLHLSESCYELYHLTCRRPDVPFVDEQAVLGDVLKLAPMQPGLPGL